MTDVKNSGDIPPEAYNLGPCTWCGKPATDELITSLPKAKKRTTAPICLDCTRELRSRNAVETVMTAEDQKIKDKAKAAQRRAYVVY